MSLHLCLSWIPHFSCLSLDRVCSPVSAALSLCFTGSHEPVSQALSPSLLGLLSLCLCLSASLWMPMFVGLSLSVSVSLLLSLSLSLSLSLGLFLSGLLSAVLNLRGPSQTPISGLSPHGEPPLPIPLCLISPAPSASTTAPCLLLQALLGQATPWGGQAPQLPPHRCILRWGALPGHCWGGERGQQPAHPGPEAMEREKQQTPSGKMGEAGGRERRKCK